MDFSLTTADLQKLKNNKTVTVGEIISLLFDICQDAAGETGATLDQLPLGSEEILYKRLPWASRFLMKIYDQINIPKEMGIVIKKMDQTMAGFREKQAQAEELIEKIRKLDTEKQRLDTETQRLDEQEKLLGDRLYQQEKLEEQVHKRQHTLEVMQNADLAELKNRLQETDLAISLLNQQLAQYGALAEEKEKCRQDAESRLEKITAEVQNLDRTVSACHLQIQEKISQKEELTDQFNQSSARLDSLDEEATVLRDRLEQLSRQLESCDTVSLQQRLEHEYINKQMLLEEYRKKQAELARIETELQDGTGKLSGLESLCRAASMSLAEQRKDLEYNRSLLDQLRQQEKEIGEQLKEYDSQEFERIKGRVSSLCNALNQFRSDQEKLKYRFPAVGDGAVELRSRVQQLKQLCIDYSEQYQNLIQAFESGQIGDI